MKIRPHMPDFTDFNREPEQEFESFAEAASHMPIPQRFAADGFERWEWSRLDDSTDFLMARMKDGTSWVVGYVTPPIEWRGDLPQWMPKDSRTRTNLGDIARTGTKR